LPPEQKTSDGMVLRISRHFQQEQIYTVTMPCETVYCSDPALPAGVQRVLIQGQNGELLRHADVTYTNGQETGRDITSEEVLIQPKNTLVAVGTGLKPVEADEALPVIQDGLIYLPTGEVLTYSKVISSLATAYCDKGKTATGTQARVGAIAVDPEVIPYGTRMFILTKDGEYIYGIATAEDCGSKKFIYGTRIDLHYDTEYECRQFGARMCWVYFLS
jgi:3D (Asp-Asp-Asp) domain-containing protein